MVPHLLWPLTDGVQSPEKGSEEENHLGSFVPSRGAPRRRASAKGGATGSALYQLYDPKQCRFLIHLKWDNNGTTLWGCYEHE